MKLLIEYTLDYVYVILIHLWTALTTHPCKDENEHQNIVALMIFNQVDLYYSWTGMPKIENIVAYMRCLIYMIVIHLANNEISFPNRWPLPILRIFRSDW